MQEFLPTLFNMSLSRTKSSMIFLSASVCFLLASSSVEIKDVVREKNDKPF